MDEKNKRKPVHKEPRSFFHSLMLEYLKSHPRHNVKDLYNRLGTSRQNFWNRIYQSRNVSAEAWPAFRRALGLTHAEFWSRARAFYDPPDATT